MDAAASGNIQVDSAIRVRYVIALEILAGVQEHGVCRVSGLLEDGREAQQILSSTEDIPICIIRKDEWNEILFRGIVRRAEIYTVNGVYHTRIDAVTVSEKLDRVKMQRSFQDVTMTYEQVAGRVLEPYGDMGATFVEEAKQAIGEPVLQYGETDWQFLKRLGSHLHVPLYADSRSGSRVLHFGMEQGISVDGEPEVCSVGISRKYYEADPGEDNVTRKEYVYHKVRSKENGQIGDLIDTCSGTRVIFKKCIRLVQEQLEFHYWAGEYGNWYIPRIKHDCLTGMEFIGKVVSTQAEKMKVSLRIDEPYEGADYEWEWTPATGNIMYAMPEKGSSVRLYFGSDTASEGTAYIDPRDNGESMPGQQKRTFMTAAGKKMELHPEHLSLQGAGGQTAVSDGKEVMFGSSSRMELTAAGSVRLEAARIHAYTPQEINMFKSPAYCEEREKDIIPSGTRSNPPTGTGDAGFTFNYEFNAMSDVSILCGQEFTRYRPYNDDPEETELDLDGFCWEELLGNCLAGLAAVGTVTALAAYGASVVFTGGATAAFAPWVVGGLAGFCGTAAVGGMAINDYRRQEVSGLGSYVLTGMTSSAEGAVAGAAFFMVPYASEVVMAQAVPYGMTGIMLPTGAFVSGETIMTAAMTTGYTMTGSNMLVKVNDSMAGLTRTNMMAGAMGQANYQLVKGTSKGGSDVVIGLGLSNPRLYGTNNNVGNIKENASYKNGKPFTDNPFDESGKLKPNVSYQTGEFNYNYESDDKGRISNWNTDKLQLTERDKRLDYNSKTPGKLPGDHAGHLAGDRFGGSPKLDNIVSQSQNVNLSTYKKIENQWANAISNGQKVTVNVNIKYSGDSLRPTEFDVEYTINGEFFNQNILN